ncbi:hypothetical protein GGR56DRAFT_629785 [Xylariaceae sp. FL0804]|nr:hypothetical protein GGR56DRAFT_629785 [Xylariaceae sp. FL0804]
MSANYSIYTIPAAFFLAMLPGGYGTSLAGHHRDPSMPRGFVENVQKDDTIDKKIKGRIFRSQAASANGFETLPLYVGGVVAANFSGVPVGTINALCAVYVVSRVLYNVTYIRLQDNRKFAPLRTACWAASVISWMTLLIKAGNRV